MIFFTTSVSGVILSVCTCTTSQSPVLSRLLISVRAKIKLPVALVLLPDVYLLKPHTFNCDYFVLVNYMWSIISNFLNYSAC